jgi:hypothetical protein
LAGVRVCGVGANFWGCVFTDVVKLPLANDTVTTMGKSTPPIENVPVMTI